MSTWGFLKKAIRAEVDMSCRRKNSGSLQNDDIISADPGMSQALILGPVRNTYRRILAG